jgi:hypothetical protein
MAVAGGVYSLKSSIFALGTLLLLCSVLSIIAFLKSTNIRAVDEKGTDCFVLFLRYLTCASACLWLLILYELHGAVAHSFSTVQLMTSCSCAIVILIPKFQKTEWETDGIRFIDYVQLKPINESEKRVPLLLESSQPWCIFATVIFLLGSVTNNLGFLEKMTAFCLATILPTVCKIQES